MSANVEIIEFFRPEGGRKNLFVTNLPGCETEDTIQEQLFQDFFRFGLLFEVQVFPLYGKPKDEHEVTRAPTCPSLPEPSGKSRQLPTQPTGCYAFVKFFSCIAAGRAKSFLDGSTSFPGHPYKIRYAKRRTLHDEKPPVLYIARCQELANHYLGFNGWSSTMKFIEEDKDVPAEEAFTKVRFIACSRLDITNHSLHSEGVGVWEEPVNPKEPASRAQSVCRARKLAYQRAMENAFSKVILIVLGNGKMTVEINTTRADILLREAQIDEAGLVRINELETNPKSEEEETTDWEFSDGERLDFIADEACEKAEVPVREKQDFPVCKKGEFPVGGQEVFLEDVPETDLDDVNMHILQELEDDVM